MRLDLEQFLAMTVALGTAGAIGVAVYSTHDAKAEVPAAAPVEEAAEEEFPEAEPDPPRPAPTPTPAPAAAPTPAPMPAFDAPDEQLDEAPGPQVEAW